MFPLLFFTITGFLAGLSFVMVKRKIRPGAVMSSVFLAVLAAAVWKVIKQFMKDQDNKKDFFR